MSDSKHNALRTLASVLFEQAKFAIAFLLIFLPVALLAGWIITRLTPEPESFVELIRLGVLPTILLFLFVAGEAVVVIRILEEQRQPNKIPTALLVNARVGDMAKIGSSRGIRYYRLEPGRVWVDITNENPDF